LLLLATGAKKSRDATVCETDEVSLYALGSRTVFVKIFFPRKTEAK